MIWFGYFYKSLGDYKTGKYISYNECIKRLENIAGIYYKTKDTK